MLNLLKKRGSKKIIIFLGMGAFPLFYFLLVFFTTPQTATLEELNWDAVPSVISVSPIERDGYSGTLFIRLTDGLEQFIPGIWSTSFSEQGNVYIFGSYPDDYPIDEKKKLYQIFQSESILDIDLLNIDGEIRSVKENSQGTYVLVEIEKNQTTYFCIAERLSEQSSECDELNLYGGGEATWNPQEDHEVVILNNSGEILTYDPWNPGLVQINPDAEDQYTYASNLLSGNEQASSTNTVFFHVLQWILGTEDGAPFLIRAPLQSAGKLITDEKHVLVVGTEKIQVIELDTGKSVTIYSNTNLRQKEVKFRNSFGEDFL